MGKVPAKRNKSGIGRPSKYKAKYCEMVITHMAAGFSFHSFSGIIEVNIDTLYEWAKVHPEFSDAKSLAYQKSRLFWENIGIQASLGKINTNSTIWIFNMKNRFRWRDKQPDEDDKAKAFEPIVIDLPNLGKKIKIDNKNKKDD